MTPVRSAGAGRQSNGTGVCRGPEETEHAQRRVGWAWLILGRGRGDGQGLDFLVRAGGSVERF